MEQTIRINILNNGSAVDVPMGATLDDIYRLSGFHMEHGPVVARVNNKVEGMHYRVYNKKDVEFLDIT